MQGETVHPTDFRHISFRATGGRVKAVFWHYGVRRALEERGFRFTSGFGPAAAPAPGEISTLIGSSAGCFFSLMTAVGVDVTDILNCFLGRPSSLPPIDNSVIFRPRHVAWRGYFRRIRNAVNLRAGEQVFPGSRAGTGASFGDDNDDDERVIETPKSLPFREFLRTFELKDLLAIHARWELGGLESYLRDGLLGGRDHFGDLRARLYFLATDLDEPHVYAFGDRDGDHGWYRYVPGIPMSRAAVASMAVPSVFNPVAIRLADRRHHFIDGDVYNPNETMIERDLGCDLAIVSSFQVPYRFHPAIGSLHHLGLPYEIAQTIALSIYSRFLQSRNASQQKSLALASMRDLLAPHLDEETLEREIARLARELDLAPGMRTLHLHPHRNPLLFFGNPFDLSPRTFGKLLLEAYLQASELLERNGFHRP